MVDCKQGKTRVVGGGPDIHNHSAPTGGMQPLELLNTDCSIRAFSYIKVVDVEENLRMSIRSRATPEPCKAVPISCK